MAASSGCTTVRHEDGVARVYCGGYKEGGREFGLRRGVARVVVAAREGSVRQWRRLGRCAGADGG